MVTKLRNPPSASSASSARRIDSPKLDAQRPGRAMVPEFRLLGLRPREARVDVIRQALQATAAQVHTAASIAEANEQLAQVAIAGYHLLDPRRRRSLFERVQLLLWTEEELDGVCAAGWNSANEPVASRVVATPIKPPAPPTIEQSVSAEPASTRSSCSAAEETQAALDVFRTLRKRARRATVLWVTVLWVTVLWVGVLAIMLSLAGSLGLLALITRQL